jgi:hypothetical protein
MAKISRIQQISDELTRLGVEPTQEAIDAVQAILRGDNRKTYKTACKAYCQQLNPPQQPKADRQASPNNASESTQNTQQGLNNTTRKVADVVKQTILSNGISIALKEIESGDWGDLNDKAKESLEQFNNFLDADFEVLDQNFFMPSLPPSAQNLLPSSEEIFDAEVLPEPITQS